jgi:hypothetical protein
MCLRSKHGWTAPRHILRLLKHTQCSIWRVQRIGGTKASIYIFIGDGINRTLLLGNLGAHWRMYPREVVLHSTLLSLAFIWGGGILGEGMRTLNVTWVAWVFWSGKIV